MTKESVFKKYQRKGLSEMRPYLKGEDMKGISISKEDKAVASPKVGDMIARNPMNHKDQWLVAKKYFNENLELFVEPVKTEKTFGNTDTHGAKKNVKDIVFWGNGDTFKLISKASSKNEGWMKSTKAMEIFGLGCVIQITTQHGDNVSEAVTFVPKCKVLEQSDKDGNVIGRKIVHTTVW